MLDGTVRAAVPTPDGSRLFVGGQLNNVNGQPISGLVELDPTTGAALNVLQTGTSPSVFDLTLDGNDLYVVGNITRVGTGVVAGAGRINIATGAADQSWTPLLTNGPTRAVAVQASGARVFVGGSFAAANGGPVHSNLAAIDVNTGLLDANFDIEALDLAVTDNEWARHGEPGTHPPTPCA